MAAVEVRPGVAIAHERSGSGPPLVLVHGITESRRSWDPLVPLLAEHFDVVAPDLRGYGESTKTAPFDVGTLAEDITELVPLLRLDRPLLIGHSLGGVVVSAMAAACSRRCMARCPPSSRTASARSAVPTRGRQPARARPRAVPRPGDGVRGAGLSPGDRPAARGVRPAASARRAVTADLWRLHRNPFTSRCCLGGGQR